MNVIVNIEEICARNIVYYEPVTNTIMENSMFVKTGFTNKLFTLNNICIEFEVFVTKIEKYFNKCNYIFEHNPIIQCISELENKILGGLNRSNLFKTYKLKEQLEKLNLRLYNCNDNMYHIPKPYKFYLKISGIWTTSQNYGLTFKISRTNL